jgi:transcriptional regulator with XRE-family HTH domain
MEAQDYVKQLLAAGLTQTVIAERSGIPQPTISKIARGDVTDVMSRNYRKLQALHATACAPVAAAPASKEAA